MAMGGCMSKKFYAQSLVRTETGKDNASLELTFVDARGNTETINVPGRIAMDLGEVLTSLAGQLAENCDAKLTRVPKLCAVGHARHEGLVLIRFDDDPPYGLEVDKASELWRELRQEAERMSHLKVPTRQ
jgi:hypothetical protein